MNNQNKIKKSLNHKIYKGNNSYHINILPGDLQGLPDDCFYYISKNILLELT